MQSHFVGVDLGGTNLRAAVVTREHKLIGRHEVPTDAYRGPDAVLARMADTIRAAVQAAGLEAGAITAVGIGSPGPIDAKAGVVTEAPNLPGWIDIPVAARIQAATGIRTFLENDANAAGWGEYWAGAGRGCRDMVLMTLGTGIGGAVVLDGKLHVGPDGTAGEVGHVVIVDGGRLCGCGNKGCLEAYASATAVVARFKEAQKAGWASVLADRKEVSAADVFNAAKNGDNLASHIVEETGRYLGVMAANFANLLNPERCVFSGGLIKAGEILFKPIREAMRERSFKAPGERMQILPAELGEDAGLIGAAGVAMTLAETAAP